MYLLLVVTAVFYQLILAKFLSAVRSNPFSRLKPVAKDKIKDGSLTISDKKAAQKNQAKASIQKGQAVIVRSYQ